MSAKWTVHCAITADGTLSADGVAGIASLSLFDHGAVAIGETLQDDGAIHLLAGFDSRADAQSAVDAIADQFPDVRAELKSDPDHLNWVEAQRQALEPTTIGPWSIRAPWNEPTAVGAHDVVIDPGAAFGHGAHPSTRLSIELMLQELAETQTVVDLGTGTGVIAIVAARWGCPVRAIEYDPVAERVARQNIERNGVEHLIQLTQGDAFESRVEPDDLVVANVTIDVHRHISPTYSAADRIVVAGLLCSQVAKMRQMLPTHTAKTVQTMDEWAAVSFLRTAP